MSPQSLDRRQKKTCICVSTHCCCATVPGQFIQISSAQFPSQKSFTTSRGRCDGGAPWGWCDVTRAEEDGARRGCRRSSRHLRAERPVRAQLVNGDTAPVRPLKCRDEFPAGGWWERADALNSPLIGWRARWRGSASDWDPYFHPPLVLH